MYVFGSDWVGGVGGEWVSGLGLGFTNPGRTRGKWDMCLCFSCGGVGVEVGGRLGPGSGRVGWCYVCVCCESGLFVLMAGPGIFWGREGFTQFVQGLPDRCDSCTACRLCRLEIPPWYTLLAKKSAGQ